MATTFEDCWLKEMLVDYLTTKLEVMRIKMYQMKEKLEKMLADLHIEEKRANKELEMLPKGRLHQVLRNKKITYFQVTKENGKRVRKSINKRPDIVDDLARKMYLNKEIQMIQTNIRLLSSVTEKIEDINADEIVRRLPINVVSFFKEENGWQKQEYKRSLYKAEELKHTTSHGLKVRSKSEVIIAETLYAYDVPFRYEQILNIEGREFAPDFTIMTPFNKVYYWEHCGMTHNQQYMNHHKWKLEQYEKVGIVPWRNLIVTYDGEEGIIDTNIIRSEILNKLK